MEPISLPILHKKDCTMTTDILRNSTMWCNPVVEFKFDMNMTELDLIDLDAEIFVENISVFIGNGAKSIFSSRLVLHKYINLNNECIAYYTPLDVLDKQSLMVDTELTRLTFSHRLCKMLDITGASVIIQYEHNNFMQNDVKTVKQIVQQHKMEFTSNCMTFKFTLDENLQNYFMHFKILDENLNNLGNVHCTMHCVCNGYDIMENFYGTYFYNNDMQQYEISSLDNGHMCHTHDWNILALKLNILDSVAKPQVKYLECSIFKDVSI
jgi:hypothetical protein